MKSSFYSFFYILLVGCATSFGDEGAADFKEEGAVGSESNFEKIWNKDYWKNNRRFHAYTIGISRLRGWFYRGYYRDRNYVGFGVNGLDAGNSTTNGGHFLLELGMSYQRSLLSNSTPFVALCASIPYLYKSRDGLFEYDGIDVENGFNLPNLSLGLGFELKIFRSIVEFDFSEKRKMSSLFDGGTNFGVGATISRSFGEN